MWGASCWHLVMFLKTFLNSVARSINILKEAITIENTVTMKGCMCQSNIHINAKYYPEPHPDLEILTSTICFWKLQTSPNLILSFLHKSHPQVKLKHLKVWLLIISEKGENCILRSQAHTGAGAWRIFWQLVSDYKLNWLSLLPFCRGARLSSNKAWHSLSKEIQLQQGFRHL